MSFDSDSDSDHGEQIISMPTSSNNGIVISKRKLEPSDYTFRIESFSLLKNQLYESNDFEVGGYKWKLVLHPGDNSERGHVALHLKLVTDTTKFFRSDWKINVNFKLFVHNIKHNHYLSIQDVGVRTFDRQNMKFGFDQLISLKDIKDESKGYLYHDICEFGAEIFVIGHSTKLEILSMMKDPICCTSLRFENFSSIQNKFFTQDDIDWVLWINPTGGFLSSFLELKDYGFRNEGNAKKRQLYATYTIRILDQHRNNRIHGKTDTCWFRPSSDGAGNLFKAKLSNLMGFTEIIKNARGFQDFISLSELNKEGNGYVRNNTINMEVVIQVSMTKYSR